MKPPKPEAVELAFALLTERATFDVVHGPMRANRFTAIIDLHEGHSLGRSTIPAILSRYVSDPPLPKEWQEGDRAVHFDVGLHNGELSVGGLLGAMRGQADGDVALTLEEAWRVVVALLQPVARGMRIIKVAAQDENQVWYVEYPLRGVEPAPSWARPGVRVSVSTVSAGLIEAYSTSRDFGLSHDRILLGVRIDGGTLERFWGDHIRPETIACQGTGVAGL